MRHTDNICSVNYDPFNAKYIFTIEMGVPNISDFNVDQNHNDNIIGGALFINNITNSNLEKDNQDHKKINYGEKYVTKRLFKNRVIDADADEFL